MTEEYKIIKKFNLENSRNRYTQKLAQLGVKKNNLFDETGYSESAKDTGEGMSDFYRE